LRCPWTSHTTQNEDLITFWIFRNDLLFVFNKMKQQELLKVLTHEGCTSLNYSDSMSCVRPGWEVAHNKHNQETAWRLGGLRPFTRLPQILMELRDAKDLAKKRASFDRAEVRMSEQDFLKWGEVHKKFAMFESDKKEDESGIEHQVRARAWGHPRFITAHPSNASIFLFLWAMYATLRLPTCQC